MGKRSEQTPHERAEHTLGAIKEFRWYLEGVEKDLSSMSKKFANKEIAQGVGFAATGIHEALTYLAIVKKVIEKSSVWSRRRLLFLAMKLADWMKAILMDEQVFPPQLETRLL